MSPAARGRPRPGRRRAATERKSGRSLFCSPRGGSSACSSACSSALAESGPLSLWPPGATPAGSTPSTPACNKVSCFLEPTYLVAQSLEPLEPERESALLRDALSVLGNPADRDPIAALEQLYFRIGSRRNLPKSRLGDTHRARQFSVNENGLTTRGMESIATTMPSALCAVAPTAFTRGRLSTRYTARRCLENPGEAWRSLEKHGEAPPRPAGGRNDHSTPHSLLLHCLTRPPPLSLRTRTSRGAD